MGHEIEFLIGLLGAVALGAWLGWRASIPYPIVLFAAGLASASCPGSPTSSSTRTSSSWSSCRR